ncbi:hypothetical protein GQ44DRAFT_636227 [Phaeosphaeriaceae sp. PMI808]|nr:hypothetical protein GQ44DRAFT_636227 [Phaeosphaeriaceae sp. PMI808]
MGDESCFPQTEEQARRHIAEILRLTPIDQPNRITDFLNAALISYAGNLYADPTHFLFELLQNADDNKYTASVPTLTITYKEHNHGRNLRFDCNEIGFSRANVDSICSLGKSSKPGAGGGAKYIGEKGIGFKSVFDAAEVVWISSGYYSFKFASDESNKLGTIVPLWADFPEDRVPANTSILLNLSPRYNTQRLIKKLESMDPTFLLFFRRLKKVTIKIERSGRTWETTLERRHKATIKGGISVFGVRKGQSLATHIVFRQEVSDIRLDRRREGCTKSQILLAFPAGTFSTISRHETQQVYAFLPIRDYGLKFILQADFLLVASREDIDKSPWNEDLLAGVPKALLVAIEAFNETQLRYSWLPYVPLGPYQADLFGNLQAESIKLLSKMPILESEEEELAPPSDLGVATYSKKMFLDDLSAFISTSECEFQRMSPAWHSQVAKILAELILERTDNNLKIISGLKLIHLCNDRWIAPNQGTIVLPAKPTTLSLPKGLDVFEVHGDVEQYKSRVQLLRLLGVEQYDRRKICDIIVQTHSNSTDGLEHVLRKDLISHIAFLRRADWMPEAGTKSNLWFETEDESRHRGSSVYMDTDEPHSATDIFKGNQYDTDWCSWLAKNLDLTLLPRMALVSKAPADNFTLAPDFQVLIDTYPPLTVLLLLRERWEDYKKWVVETTDSHRNEVRGSAASRQRMKATLSSLKVPCQGGTEAMLRQTFLPRRAVLLRMGVTVSQRQDLPNEVTAEEAGRSSPGLGVPDQLTTVTVPAKNSGSLEILQQIPPPKSNGFLGTFRKILRNGSTTIPTAPSSSVHWPTSLPGGDVVLEDHTSHSPETNTISAKSPAEFLLAVSDPENQRWNFLEELGVVVKVDVLAFLGHLRLLKNNHTAKDYVEILYEQLEQCATNEDAEKIRFRQAFESEEIVFIPSKGQETGGSWVNLKACVWSGPNCLSKTPRLMNLYPARSRLFQAVVKCSNANLNTVIQEAKSIDRNDGLAYIADIFSELCRHLRPDSSGNSKGSDSIQILREYPIFPTKSRFESTGFCMLQTALESEDWYIPDQIQAAHVFNGRLNFLALDSITLRERELLINSLKIRDRLLSVAAKRAAAPEGNTQLGHAYEMYLKRRMRFVIALVPVSNRERDGVIARLRCIEILQAEKVTTRWTIKKRNVSISEQGTELGRVVLEATDRGLRLYIVAQHSETGHSLVEVATELSKFCGITNPEHSILLSYILTEQNLKYIEDEMRRRGICFEPAGPEEEMDAATPSATDVGGGHTSEPIGVQSQVAKAPTPTNLDNNQSNDMDALWSESEGPIRPSAYVSVDKILVPNLEGKDGQNQSTPNEQASDQTPKQEEGNDSKELKGSISNPMVDVGVSVAMAALGEEAGPGSQGTATGELLKAQVRTTTAIAADGHALRTSREVQQRSIGVSAAGEAQERHHWGVIPAHDQDGNAELLRSRLPRPEVEFMNMSHGVVFNPSPATMFVGEDTQETQSHGELYAKSMALSATRKARDVYILARVYEIRTQPAIALYADPWRLHEEASILLESASFYQGSVSTAASPLLVESCAIPASAIETDQVYKDLQIDGTQIRLLKLELLDQGGDENMPLKAELVRVSVNPPDRFWAISYCWGPPPTKDGPFLEVKGIRIPITDSLWTCLRCLRRKRELALVWADAVCINQQDSTEKAMQVCLMGSLYKKAERVFIWTGIDCRDDRGAIQSLDKLQKGSPLQDQQREAERINAFLGRHWFTRTWTIQELVFGSHVTVMSGDSEIEWDAFIKGVVKWKDQEQGKTGQKHRFPPNLNAVLALHRIRQDYKGATLGEVKGYRLKHSFLQLVELFFYTQSSKACDKLFALLSLAHDTTIGDGHKAFLPDYEADEAVILSRYATEFVKAGRALDLLYRAGGNKGSRFRSWIPDLMNQMGKTFYGPTISTWEAAGAGTETAPSFSAGARYSADACVKDPTVLAIRGQILDSIQSCRRLKISQDGQVIYFSNVLKDFVDYVSPLRPNAGEDWQRKLVVKCLIGDAAGPQTEARALSLSLSSSSSSSSSSGEPQQAMSSEPWTAGFENDVFSAQPGRDAHEYVNQSDTVQRVVNQFWVTVSAFLQRIPSATACITKKHYAGIVPGEAKRNDVIFVPHGAKVPFLLRKRGSEGSQHYELIGECYIDGIMYNQDTATELLDDKVYLV